MADAEDHQEDEREGGVMFTPDTDLFWDMYGLGLEVVFEPETE